MLMKKKGENRQNAHLIGVRDYWGPLKKGVHKTHDFSLFCAILNYGVTQNNFQIIFKISTLRLRRLY